MTLNTVLIIIIVIIWPLAWAISLRDECARALKNLWAKIRKRFASRGKQTPD